MSLSDIAWPQTEKSGRAIAVRFFIGFSLLAALPTHAANWSIYTKTSILARSEPLPVKEYAGDFSGDLKSGTDAFSFVFLEAGVRRDQFSVGVFKESLIMSRPSRDAVLFQFSSRNGLDFEPGERFDLSLDAYRARFRGTRFGWSERLGDFTVNVGLKYLTGEYFLDGKIAGTATALDFSDAQFDLGFDYAFIDDPVFDRDIETPDGDGWAVDLGLAWSDGDHISAWVEVRNLWGYIDWEDAGVTRADATSDTRQVDANGNVNFRAVLRGIELVQQHRQTIPHAANFGVSYGFDSGFSVGLRGFHNPVMSYSTLELAHRVGYWQAKALWIPEFDAKGLELNWHHLYFALIADDFDVDKARYLDLRIGGRLFF